MQPSKNESSLLIDALAYEKDDPKSHESSLPSNSKNLSVSSLDLDADDNIDQIFAKKKKVDSDKEKEKNGEAFVLNTANNLICV